MRETSEFYKDSLNTNGYKRICTPCLKEYGKKRYNDNDNDNEEYKGKNKDNAVSRYWAKREEILTKKSAYRKENKEKIAAKGKEYRHRVAGTEKYKAMKKAARLRRRAAGYVPVAELNKLIKSSNNVCFWCDEEIPNGEMHLDHIYPVSKGGRNDMYNLVVACRSCNQRKRDKSPEIWIEEILLEK